MNICSVCKHGFSDSDCLFIRKTGRIKLVIVCRPCNKQRCKLQYEKYKERYKTLARQRNDKNILEARKFILEFYLTHPCVDCGESDYRVLELDHVRDKRSHVSAMVHIGISLVSIKKEIDKCEVRCANCHRKRTLSSVKWNKWAVNSAGQSSALLKR